jgi:ribosomal protein L18E
MVSTSARQAIEDGGEFMFIEELVDENPEGEGVRIVK